MMVEFFFSFILVYISVQTVQDITVCNVDFPWNTTTKQAVPKNKVLI